MSHTHHNHKENIVEKQLHALEHELVKEIVYEKKTFKKSVRSFANALHPKNFKEFRTLHLGIAIALILIATPVVLGSVLTSRMRSEHEATTSKVKQAEQPSAPSLQSALTKAQNDETAPEAGVVAIDDENGPQPNAERSGESSSATRSQPNDKKANSNLIVKYKANKVVRNYYVRKKAWIIDTNTGEKLKQVYPGKRLRISHIAVRGKRAPNGEVFGYFYWVLSRQGQGKLDRGIRVDYAFAITPGLKIRNHLPLYKIKTTGGTCTSQRLWYYKMDNRLVKAFQRLHYKYGKSAITFKSAWRSAGEQECLRRNPSGYPVAQGVSKHQLGQAVDLTLTQANQYADYLRTQNICRPVSGDPIHFEPCGIR